MSPSLATLSFDCSHLTSSAPHADCPQLSLLAVEHAGWTHRYFEGLPQLEMLDLGPSCQVRWIAAA